MALRLENLLLRQGGRLLPPGDPREVDDPDELRKQIEAFKQENEELRKRLEHLEKA